MVGSDWKKRISSVVVGSCFLFMLSSCAKKQLVKKNLENPVKVSDNVLSEELDVHGKDFESSKSVATIYFDYDSSELSESARNTLSSNATYLKKNKSIEVVVEGHCDERGTVAYNLALGQKRAQAVRTYYIDLGLDPKKIGTISFGKEKPLCTESNDLCWSKNRRGETKLRTYRVADGGSSLSK